MNTQKNTTAPTTKLSKTASSYLSRLLTHKADVRVALLSEFYQSRSTKYAGCLKEAPFVIKTDRESITAAGFSPSAKAVITLDLSSPVVQSAIADLKARIAAQDKAETLRREERVRMTEALPAAVTEAMPRITERLAGRSYGGLTRKEVNELVGLVGKGYNYAKVCGNHVVTNEILRQLRSTNA